MASDIQVEQISHQNLSEWAFQFDAVSMKIDRQAFEKLGDDFLHFAAYMRLLSIPHVFTPPGI